MLIHSINISEEYINDHNVVIIGNLYCFDRSGFALLSFWGGISCDSDRFWLSPASANYVTILITGFTVISGILIGPPVFGWLANFVGAAVLPAYIIASNVLFVIASFYFLKKLKQR
ncbi:MAG: hypothetical protein J6D15_02990 [Clostridia bacterium]|nr:hypothetical protein [Clostridia bacterium]